MNRAGKSFVAVHDRETFPVQLQEIRGGFVALPNSVLSQHQIGKGESDAFGRVRKSEHGRFLRWCFLEAVARRLARFVAQTQYVNLLVIIGFEALPSSGRLNTQIINLARVSAFANPANRAVNSDSP